MYKGKARENFDDSIYVYQKITFNNNIFYQLNLKCKWDFITIMNIANKDNNTIFLLSVNKKYIKLTLSIIKINGFKTIKKIDLSEQRFPSLWDYITKTFCFMINKTIMIHLCNIILIDLDNSDKIYEIPGLDGEFGHHWASRIYYDKYKKYYFCLGDMLSIIELNKKERKIEIMDSINLFAMDLNFLFLMDDILFIDRYKKTNASY